VAVFTISGITLDNHLFGWIQQFSCFPRHLLQGGIARGMYGLPKVLLGPAMPDLSRLCERPPLKRPYNRVMDGRYKVGGLRQSYYPLGYPIPYASDSLLFGIRSLFSFFSLLSEIFYLG
jgi:hypothetical protein